MAFWRRLETEKRNERLFGRIRIVRHSRCRVSASLAIVSLRFKLRMSQKMLLTASEVSYITIKNAVAICLTTGKGLKKTKYPAFRLKFF